MPPAPSAPPSSVSVSEVTSCGITVQWGPVDCIHRNGAITGYSVQYGRETVSVSGDSSGGMYVISGLMPSTTYSIQVAAQTSAGTGPCSTAIDQTTSSEICTVLRFYVNENQSTIKLQVNLHISYLPPQEPPPPPFPGLELALTMSAMWLPGILMI